MAGPKKCPDCGSLDIVEDSHYSQNQLVCADCGFILTEGLLTTTFSEEQHLQEVTYSRSTGENEQLSRCLQRGIKRVRDLCKVLHLPSLFEETAVSYYQQAIKHPCFSLVHLEKKEIIVGCCVFVTCRQHNWPLTMGTVCLLLYADKEVFAGVYMQFLKEMSLDVPSLSLIDLVKAHLNSFKLFQQSSDIPPKFVEDKEQLVERTIQIVELSSETWLVTGRRPIPIVMAAAFLAWQSLRPLDRFRCTLSEFCKLAGTDVPPPAHRRLRELHNIFLQMASHLAWLQVLKVNKRTVAKYVDDLLKHRHVLLQTVFSRMDSTEGCNLEGSAPEVPQQLIKGSSVMTGKKSLLVGGQKGGRKRVPLLPPCMLNPKKLLKSPDLRPEDSAITGDEPISDSELEQYIRTSEEEEVFREAQRALNHCSHK
uniref:Transcription factor IIIB 50 kDa subunit n=1 Tax=Anolis carolinensis TaxID=28377 RepID=H9G3F2_ANOCA|nr:PREDICTED: transcription factor IIIB 50 kDa subunit [Anolis carolinensis]|eukprot:XP_003226791.1 PREDICTED: transcription factor IIIB 50 kDa subunit [Anolis carolinensis]